MISLMCSSKNGETFKDLLSYHKSLKDGTYRKEQVEEGRFRITSKKSQPIQYKTDPTNYADFNDADNMSHSSRNTYSPKIESKRVTRILYQWNYETKSHDVIHEYDDGTSEIIEADKKDAPKQQSGTKDLERGKSADQHDRDSTKGIGAPVDKQEDLKPKLDDEKDRHKNRSGHKSNNIENNGQNEIPKNHIANDKLSIVVTPEPEKKKKDKTLFTKDFSYLNHVGTKTYVTAGGKEIKMSNSNRR